MEKSPSSNSGEAQTSRDWSVLEGSFNPELAPPNFEQQLNRWDELVKAAHENETYYAIINTVMYALEISNPELPPEATTDVIRVSRAVADRYTTDSLRNLRGLTKQIETTPPAAMIVLDNIFKYYKNREDSKIAKLDIRAKAYGVIRVLHLLQTGREDELPTPLEQTVQ